MQVTVTVSDKVVREASARGMQVSDFVEQLIDKGFEHAHDNNNVSTAIDRIRALRTHPADASRG